MFFWEALGPGIHVDVTLKRTTHMATVLPDGSGLPQQADASHHTTKTAREWLKERNKPDSKLPRS